MSQSLPQWAMTTASPVTIQSLYSAPALPSFLEFFQARAQPWFSHHLFSSLCTFHPDKALPIWWLKPKASAPELETYLGKGFALFF